MAPEMISFCQTKAYYIRHGTGADVRKAKDGDFYDLCLYALGTVARDHGNHKPLHIIYDDIHAAYHIASSAMPITMEHKTFGQWVRWYELTIMPTWVGVTNES